MTMAVVRGRFREKDSVPAEGKVHKVTFDIKAGHLPFSIGQGESLTNLGEKAPSQ